MSRVDRTDRQRSVKFTAVVLPPELGLSWCLCTTNRALRWSFQSATTSRGLMSGERVRDDFTVLEVLTGVSPGGGLAG